MILKKMVREIEYKIIQGSLDVDISSVIYDSKKVQGGSLFICIKGSHSDGHQYIKKAVENGAIAVIIEDRYEDIPKDIILIQVVDTRKALAYISGAWFNNPAEKMHMIAITGTKGKTTSSYMMKGIFEENGDNVGIIGTLGAYNGAKYYETNNTTPESYIIQSLLAEMLLSGCKYVIMEVSSQALKQDRVTGIVFDVGIFLNISPDHISEYEHKDFEEYLHCKSLLFHQVKNAIINIDAERWQDIIKETNAKLYTFSIEGTADFIGSNIEKLWERGILGTRFVISGRENAIVKLNMPGKYNVSNALSAIAVAALYRIDMHTVSTALEKIYVKGRTQLICEASHFTTLMIDYAHNAISMDSLLCMLKEYNPERLICLFGAGGNKPIARRYDMGKAAGKYADFTVITMDNPRYECVADINKEIIRGLKEYKGKYVEIIDRAEAIRFLINQAGKYDIIVLIGKGHEEYQEINGNKYYFSEEKIILDYLATK